MLRRCSHRGAPAWVAKLRGAYDVDTMRLKDAKTGKGTNIQTGDPVYTKFLHESNMRPIRRNSANAFDATKDFMQADEVTKWMDVEQAARILGIKADVLIGLKAATIEQAWAALYKTNRFANNKKNEITTAAEVLLRYIDSDLHTKKQQRHYSDRLEKMRLEIEHELNKDKEQMKEWAMHGTGLMMTLGAAVIVVMLYLKTYAETVTVESSKDKLRKYMNVTFLQSTNVEPPPDYITRYRDTPTAIEVDRANGVDYDHSFTELAATHDLKQATKDEDAYLLNMMNEENELALREAKAARQSTWRPAEHTNKTVADSSNGIVIPLTGKVIAREQYEPTLTEFVGAVSTVYPSAMGARGNHMLDKAKQQDETVARERAFKAAQHGSL